MIVTELKPHEVFVFGSNASGFHGAGAAGLACRGERKNSWRHDEWFLQAMRAEPGSPDRVGKWAIYGQAKGFMQGREGKSYAIVTIKKPGEKRSVSRREIYSQLIELWDFIKSHPEYNFLITPLGEGLAGYTSEEMKVVWDYLFQNYGFPFNVCLLKEKK